MTPEEVQKRVEEMRRNPPALGTYAMHLSDYKKVDGVMLPHKIEISLDGEPNEEWTSRNTRSTRRSKPTFGKRSNKFKVQQFKVQSQAEIIGYV